MSPSINIDIVDTYMGLHLIKIVKYIIIIDFDELKFDNSAAIHFHLIT